MTGLTQSDAFEIAKIPINKSQNKFHSPIITEITLLKFRDVQHIFVAIHRHWASIGGIEKEWILIPHHLLWLRDKIDVIIFHWNSPLINFSHYMLSSLCVSVFVFGKENKILLTSFRCRRRAHRIIVSFYPRIHSLIIF